MGRRKKKYNIGVLIGGIHTYHPKELIDGIHQAGKDFDINLVFFLGTQKSSTDKLFNGYSLGEDYEYQVDMIYDYSYLAKLDVLIISYGTIGIYLKEDNYKKFLEKYAFLPNVVLEQKVDGNYIISDNYYGMRKIVEHLVWKHNYHKIAFISGPIGNLDADQRRSAYLDVMEENGLTINEGYLYIGEYTEMSGRIGSGAILDQYPDVQAIVCSNDEMAHGAYMECKRRDIVVGEDIAITGYDNCMIARNLDPPLTTIDQNGYDMGYLALKEAIRICESDEKKEIIIPARMVHRESCGCNLSTTKLTYNNPTQVLEQMDDIVSEVLSKAILNLENEALVQYTREHVKQLLSFVVRSFAISDEHLDLEYDKNYAIHILRKIIAGRYGKLISTGNLISEINSIIMGLISNENRVNRKICLMEINTAMQDYAHANMQLDQNETLEQYKVKSWMGTLFAKRLLENIHDEQLLYLEIIKQLQAFEMKAAYIYTLKDPIWLDQEEKGVVPNEIYLAAYFDENGVESYELSERPRYTKKKKFGDHIFGEVGRNLYSYPLYSGATQYGILVCEINPVDINAIYTYSLELSNVLRFMELSKKEKSTQEQLEQSFALLKEKNEVLSFISEYDELTSVLNRRGFSEQAIRLNSQNENKNGYFVFADLDHLKEINDTFGHSEGDFAITQSARIFSMAIEQKGIVGRIGGDEFVVMIVTESKSFEKTFRKKVKDAFAELNKHSDKPYYVECSMGITPIRCEKDFALTQLINSADYIMYNEKLKRRKTIKKCDC